MQVQDRLTMKEAAKYLGHSYSWLYANHRVLGIKGYKLGSRWFFDVPDLDCWIQAMKSDGGWGWRRPQSYVTRVEL